MKKVLFSIVLLLVLTAGTNAQMRSAANWIGKFGIAGGFTPVYLLPDLGAINNNAFGFNVDELSENGFIGFGGAGYGYIMVVKNLRVGGIGFGGTTSVDAVNNNVKQEIVYSNGVGGLTLEYTLPFVKGLAISVGSIIGRGNIEIEVYNNAGSVSFEDLSNSESTVDVNHVFRNKYWIFSPTLNVDIPLNRFIAIRVGAGYNISFGGEWEADNGRSVNNVPDDINGSYPFIQTGIFMGLFSF